MITQHIKELVSRKFSGLSRIISQMWGKNKICKIFFQTGRDRAMFRVHFGKYIYINDIKMISKVQLVSRPQPIFPKIIKFNIQYITAMKCITTNKKIREIGVL